MLIRSYHSIIVVVIFFILISYVPTTSYAQTSSKTISKSQLLAIGKIDVNVEDFNFDVEYKVVSYSVSAIIAGYSIEIINVGAKFNQETISLIKRLKSGQKIYFENIKVKYPDNRIKVIDPLIYKII